MPTPTYTPIASTTLSSSQASVTFSNLDTLAAGMRDLILVGSVQASGAYVLSGTVNGNTSSIYNWVHMRGNGSATASGGFSNFAYANFSDGIVFLGSEWENFTLSLFDIAQTDKHKSWLCRGNSATYGGTSATAGRIATTNAITSINVYPGANNWAIGSTFSLYGVIA